MKRVLVGSLTAAPVAALLNASLVSFYVYGRFWTAVALIVCTGMAWGPCHAFFVKYHPDTRE